MRGGVGAAGICPRRSGCTTKHLTFGGPCALGFVSGPGSGDHFLFEMGARCEVAGREHCGRCCASPWNNASCGLTQQKGPCSRQLIWELCDDTDEEVSTTDPLAEVAAVFDSADHASSLRWLGSDAKCHMVQWYDMETCSQLLVVRQSS